MRRIILLSVCIIAFFILKIRTLPFEAQFVEAMHNTFRVHRTRINSNVKFPCFASKNSSHSSILKLSTFLRNAVWDGPSGNRIFPGNVENSKIMIDSMKTLMILVSGVKDSGIYRCIMTLDGGIQIIHEVKLEVYAVPEVGLKTPFVFKIIGNCMQSVHHMNDLLESISNHLCGKINSVTKRRRSCQYNISLKCQPFHTYRSIMLGLDEQIQSMKLKNVSKIVESRLFRTPKKFLRIPLITTASRLRPHKTTKLKRKRDREDVSTMRPISRSSGNKLYLGDNLSGGPTYTNINNLNRNLKLKSKHTSVDRALWQNDISFQWKIDGNDDDATFGRKTETFRSRINIENISNDNKYLNIKEKSNKNRERLLSMLKNVIVIDDDFGTTESNPSLTTSFKHLEHENHISDDVMAPDITFEDSKVLETTPFLSEEAKELLKLNDIFKEENTDQVAVMYLLKIPDPRFNPPSCSDDCILNFKILHITWHINVILNLVKFIASSTKLPHTSTLLAETVAKGRVFAFCLPGFFLKGNSCIPCPPGSYNAIGMLNRCDLCLANSYQDQYGSKRCHSCPKGTGTQSQKGSSKLSDCIDLKSTENYWKNSMIRIFLLLMYSLLVALCIIFFYTLCKAIFRIDQPKTNVRKKWRQYMESDRRTKITKTGLKPKRRKM